MNCSAASSMTRCWLKRTLYWTWIWILPELPASKQSTATPSMETPLLRAPLHLSRQKTTQTVSTSHGKTYCNCLKPCIAANSRQAFTLIGATWACSLSLAQSTGGNLAMLWHRSQVIPCKCFCGGNFKWHLKEQDTGACVCGFLKLSQARESAQYHCNKRIKLKKPLQRKLKKEEERPTKMKDLLTG